MRGTSSDSGYRATSKKWSPKEVEQLLDAINAAHCPDAKDINWAYVAIHVPTRTGKQCREKYKNDLRPDLSKSPWTGQEEYILARAHCEIGNLWAEIGHFLPGRSENTIKNKWNATLRAKADTKAHTLLWTYAQTWQAQNKNTSLEVFEMAVREFCRQNGQASFDNVKVPESFFQDAGLCGRGVGSSGGLASSASEVASLGGSQPQRGGRPANARQTSRRAQPRHGNRKRSRSAYDSEEEGDQEDWSDSEDEGGRAATKRPHTKRTGTAMIQQQLRRQRQQQQQEELERLELSQLPPPAYMPQSFALPSTLPFQAPPQPPPPPPSNTLVPPFPQQQQQQQQHQQPAAFPPRAPALADITNLAHLSPLEPSATIKLCVPKHAQDSLKGFSFISDAAPHSATCQPSQAGGMGIQGGGEYSQQQQGQDVQGSMGTLLQQQGAALHARTPGCKLGHAAAQLGSPTPGLGRAGLNPASYLSPAMPQVGVDMDYLAYLREIGLESTNEYNHSPATLPLLKLLGSARRDSGYGLGSGFGGSTVKTLPLFGNASRRDSLLLAGGTARRDSWLISGGGRKESLGATGSGLPSNRPSWLSKPSGPQPLDLLSDPPATQPSDLQSDLPQPSDLHSNLPAAQPQLSPRQHEQQSQNPQEQPGLQQPPSLGMSDARHLLPELSLRAPQRLPELSLHAPQQLAELTPPQQLPEPLLRAPDDGQHNLPQQSRDLQQPPQPTLHPAASPGFGSCHTRSAGSGVGEFPHMTQAAAWLAAASPRLGVGSSPTCGFVSGCFL